MYRGDHHTAAVQLNIRLVCKVVPEMQMPVTWHLLQSMFWYSARTPKALASRRPGPQMAFACSISSRWSPCAVCNQRL